MFYSLLKHGLLMLISLILSLMWSFPSPLYAQNYTGTITIPLLGVQAEIIPVEIQKLPGRGNTWDVSALNMTVGYFTHLPWFGQGSNVVLGGHALSSMGNPDVFYNLDELAIGDDIFVRANGQEYHYRVAENFTVDKYELRVLYPTLHEQITLITCERNSYNTRTNRYQRRVVIVAVPVGQ